jgi:hypoxanthine phosphoribosyltransferase
MGAGKIAKKPQRKRAPVLKPLIGRARIKRRLSEMAREISRLVPARERPLAVIVLQGAFIFGADLLRCFPHDYPLDVAFLRCQSYGSATYSSGHVLLMQDLEPSIDLRGRTVLLIDDILDSGLTTRFLINHLTQRGAARVRLCVLLHRKAGNRGAADDRPQPDFAGFPIGPHFIVGYGLDYDGKYRHLPDLAALDGVH